MSVLHTGENENAAHLTAITTVEVVLVLYVVRMKAIFVLEGLHTHCKLPLVSTCVWVIVNNTDPIVHSAIPMSGIHMILL